MQIVASLSLPSAPDTVVRALAWLKDVAAQQGWSQASILKLSLCVDEALSNILMYGFHDRSEAGAIDLAALQGPGMLAVDIVDNGVAFDPTVSVSPELASSLDDAKVGGHGLRLMRHYLQGIQYRREHERNHLRLILAVDAAGGQVIQS